MSGKLIRLSLLVFFLFSVCKGGVAQATIHGPVCVVPGTEYQYNIGGINTNDSTISICLQGGVIAGTATNCRQGTSIAMIRVVWKDTAAGVINLITGAGNTTLTIGITKPLQGGMIDSLAVLQTVQAGAMVSGISCSLPSGGHCNPEYAYQWEQSADNVTWSNIAGSTGPALSLSAALSQTTYYRRKVTSSNSVAYSSIAAIIVLR